MLLIIPSLVLLAALVYLVYELREIRSENHDLVQQLIQVQQQSGGTEEGQKAYLKGAVKNTIVKHSQSIQGCFFSLIESTPELQKSGKVLVDWQIDREGKVFETGVLGDEFLNKEFQNCLREKIGEIIFPVPPSVRPVYVEHTFLFRKENKK